MFLLSILPRLAHAAASEIPPLLPAYGELPPTFWELHQTTIIVAGFAFLALVFLFLKTMLRAKTPKILSPEVEARQALTSLQNEPEDGNTLSTVSQILRRYVSKAFNLPNHELTTSECCVALARNESIGADLSEKISSFLRECDVRKFSPAHLAAPIAPVHRALELVELAEDHRALRSAPVPGAAVSKRESASANQQPIKSPDTAASGDRRTP
jgi:hypothetical protein